jgi:hypothetical protein
VIFLKRPVDFTYDAIAVLCWSHSELSSGIICAAIPTLKPLLGKYIPALGSARRSIRGYRKYEDGSKTKDSTLPTRTDVSLKDGGIYGLSDLETGLNRPHPARLNTIAVTVSKTSPKVNLPVSIRSLSTPSVEDDIRAATGEGQIAG